MNPANLFSLSGRVALVTGGNTGLGQAIAIALASAGADIVIAGRTAPTETLEKIASLGRRAHSIQCDLEQSREAHAVVARAVALGSRLDILVNNAVSFVAPTPSISPKATGTPR